MLLLWVEGEVEVALDSTVASRCECTCCGSIILLGWLLLNLFVCLAVAEAIDVTELRVVVVAVVVTAITIMVVVVGISGVAIQLPRSPR